MQKTTNYQLNQWEPADGIDRAAFNADNAAIDAALASLDTALAGKAEQTDLAATNAALDSYKTDNDAAVAAVAAALGSGGKNCRIAWGSYTGTGTYGASNPTVIRADFTIVAVLVGNSTTVYSADWHTMLLRDCCCAQTINSASSLEYITWGDTYVSMYCDNAANRQLNSNGVNYYYVIIGYDAA